MKECSVMKQRLNAVRVIGPNHLIEKQLTEERIWQLSSSSNEPLWPSMLRICEKWRRVDE